MQLISIKQARSIWLIHLIDLNPHGRSLIGVIPSIISKYKFQIFPTKPEDFDLSAGIKFQMGIFQKDPKNDISIDLTIYNDGFVVDTRSSTDDSDLFLGDFLTLIIKELGLVPYQEVLRSKLYISELWVKTDKSLNTINPKLEGFAKKISSLIVGRDQSTISYETSGIVFMTNPTIANSPLPFKFERSIDSPFKENRYFSVAPLQTNVHIDLLEELENILLS